LQDVRITEVLVKRGSTADDMFDIDNQVFYMRKQVHFVRTPAVTEFINATIYTNLMFYV